MGQALTQLTTTLFGTGETPGVIATVFEWMTSADVLPFFAIGIGISLALVGVKIIRSVIWGA